MVIFNIYALLQVIILSLFTGLIFVTGLNDYFVNAGFEDKACKLFLFYAYFFITCFTELKGMQGRVFFVPVWIWLITLIALTGAGLENSIYSWLNFFTAVLLIIWFQTKLRRKSLKANSINNDSSKQNK